MVLQDTSVCEPLARNVRDTRYILKCMFCEDAPMVAMLRATKAAMVDDHAQASFWIDVYHALQQPSEDD